jgi:hypothetical protein
VQLVCPFLATTFALPSHIWNESLKRCAIKRLVRNPVYNSPHPTRAHAVQTRPMSSVRPEARCQQTPMAQEMRKQEQATRTDIVRIELVDANEDTDSRRAERPLERLAENRPLALVDVVDQQRVKLWASSAPDF